MCGIFGQLNVDKKTSLIKDDEIQSMGETLFHRGPDHQGFYNDGQLAIGNQRLAIIDPKEGNQPFYSDDESIVVVQNGEIYNYLELKNELIHEGVSFRTNSDTEIILKLYEKKGIDFLHDLNGMFAIAIIDKKKQTQYIVRDRLGVKPLYYNFQNNTLAFASEIKSLVKKKGFEAQVDHNSLYFFLKLGFLPPPLTIFKDIAQLKPGHLIQIHKGKIDIKSWWSLNQTELLDLSTEQWLEEITNLFEHAVKIRTRADVAFGAFLSGGIDSSWVVANMSRILDHQKIKTFTVSFNNTAFDELSSATYVAKKFNTINSSVQFNKEDLNLWQHCIYHCDQPHADLSFLPTFKLSKLAAKDVKMVLTGDGADEFFAGYSKYLNFTNLEQLESRDFLNLYLKTATLFSDNLLKELLLEHNPENQDQFENYFLNQIKDVTHFDNINKALYLDTNVLLPGNNLMKPDKMGMAVSLEARPPFMDYRLAEMAFKIPGNMKLTNNETKYLIKKAAVSNLGEDIVYRKKQMFSVPVTEWDQEGLYKLVNQFVLPQVKKRNLFSYQTIENMLKKHKISSRNYLRELRGLIALEFWFKSYID